MLQIIINLGWAAVFIALSALIGVILILVATLFLPRLIDRLTPTIDEDKEIARGNRAVAEYFGRIVSAGIIGISIIIAAAILGGIIFAVA